MDLKHDSWSCLLCNECQCISKIPWTNLALTLWWIYFWTRPRADRSLMVEAPGYQSHHLCVMLNHVETLGLWIVCQILMPFVNEYDWTCIEHIQKTLTCQTQVRSLVDVVNNRKINMLSNHVQPQTKCSTKIIMRTWPPQKSAPPLGKPLLKALVWPPSAHLGAETEEIRQLKAQSTVKKKDAIGWCCHRSISKIIFEVFWAKQVCW